MKRQRAKARPLYRYDRYRGARRLWDWIGLGAAAVCAVLGLLLVFIRSLGIRFSGFLLLGLAALLAMEVLLDRWARRSQRGWRCRLAFRAAVALVLVPLVILEGYVIAEGRQPPAEDEPAAAVVVLGAGVNGETPSLVLQSRIEAAAAYLRAHPDIPAVLSGGQGPGEDITEAEAMRRALEALGVEPERLILEDRSTSTAENFACSKPLLYEAGVAPARDTVAVVTNGFHVARSELIAARQGYGDVTGVPAELPWAHLTVNYYLREAFAMVKTFLLD